MINTTHGQKAIKGDLQYLVTKTIEGEAGKVQCGLLSAALVAGTVLRIVQHVAI